MVDKSDLFLIIMLFSLKIGRFLCHPTLTHTDSYTQQHFFAKKTLISHPKTFQKGGDFFPAVSYNYKCKLVNVYVIVMYKSKGVPLYVVMLLLHKRLLMILIKRIYNPYTFLYYIKKSCFSQSFGATF